MESIRLFEEEREADVLVKAPYVFSLKEKSYVPSKKTVTAATVTTADEVIEEGIPSINVGDILYEDGTTLKTIDSAEWSATLGTPIAVCVVPSSHMADGKARFISIYGLNEDGSANTTSDNGIVWDNSGSGSVPEPSSLLSAPMKPQVFGGIVEGGDFVDTPLPNDTQLPCVGRDDDGNWTPDNTVDHTNGYAFLPSDSTNGEFTAVTNPLDEGTAWAYNDEDCHIASPYNSDGSQNTAYTCTELNDETIANPLAKFNGKQNTATLVGLGSNFMAANACDRYSTSLTNEHDWFLPSVGELAYIIPRFNKINTAIQKALGIPLNTCYTYWSSSEYSLYTAYFVDTCNGGYVDGSGKEFSSYVRPFVSLTL